jgi:TonB-dependent SusC/RagA subfamily outer membrane receptor
VVEQRTITFPASVVAEFREHGMAAVPGRGMTVRLGEGIRAVAGVVGENEHLIVVDGVIVGAGTDAASADALFSADVEMLQTVGAGTPAAERFGRPLLLITTKNAPARPATAAAPARAVEEAVVLLRESAVQAGQTQPLFVVDGVILSRPAGATGLELPGLTPDRIESIEVVKGAAAAALYGSRAAGGVIMIRTKK